jgi:hypothetical protein
MLMKLVATIGWMILALFVGGALYGIGDAILTTLRRRHGEPRAQTDTTEAQSQRLGCISCMPVLLALILGIAGRLPGTGGGNLHSWPALPRTLLLSIVLAALGLCFTPAIVLGIWRLRSPNPFAEAGSALSVIMMATGIAGVIAGGVFGLLLGLIL